MPSNLDRYKADLQRLIYLGTELQNVMFFNSSPDEFIKQVHSKYNDQAKTEKRIKELPDFKSQYEIWYSESKALIKLLLPDRIIDFIKYYERPKNRKDLSYENYTIEDYLVGLTLTRGYAKVKVIGPEAAIPKFQQQLNILKAAERRFESSLFDIKQLAQADLFDSELDSAKELLKNKFLRAAGAIAGVILEKHLAQVCSNHNIALVKKDPTINDYNELLKKNNVVDIPQWRFIQHLGDLRNLSDHDKKTEPTFEEITDMINGVDKTTKTLF